MKKEVSTATVVVVIAIVLAIVIVIGVFLLQGRTAEQSTGDNQMKAKAAGVMGPQQKGMGKMKAPGGAGFPKGESNAP